MLLPESAADRAAGLRHRCPCGAVAERRNGQCRKCQARAAWRRKATQKTRRNARRLAARRPLMRLFAEATEGGEK